MSTQRNRLSPAPVRQGALCMCAHGHPCTSFAPGHAVHLIQARLASATPLEWVDATVTATDAAGGEILAHTLDGEPLTLWNGDGAAAHLVPGAPVSYHPRYHLLGAGGRAFNVLTR